MGAMSADLATTLPRTHAVIERGLSDRTHIGAQLHVSLHDQPVIDTGVGEAGPGVAMDADSILIWMSSSKPVTAVAILQRVERGELALDDPIARHLPAFAQNGKDAITIRHALTHTGGFRGVATRMDALPYAETIAAICAQRPEPGWTPGKKAGYHIASSWYVLSAIVGGGDATGFSNVVRNEIFLPLGMIDSRLGMPANVFDAYGDRLGIMHQTDGGQVRPHPTLDSKDATIVPKPGSNARGPMRELARFYRMLLNGGSLDGVQILRPETVAQMTSRQRRGMFDQTFRLTVDWGLGVILNTPGDDMQKFAYGFGPHASMRAFGHGGNQSSLGMADPEHGLVVAVVFNGMPGETAHADRMRSLMAAIYEDLDLAP